MLNFTDRHGRSGRNAADHTEGAESVEENERFGSIPPLPQRVLIITFDLKYADTPGSDTMPKTAGLFDSLLGLRSRELANRIATEVSQRCDEHPQEWGVTTLRWRSIDFIRGYLRAKLAGEIRLETDNAMRLHGASPDLQPMVTALATEQLIDLAIRRILKSQADPTNRRMAA